MKKIIFFGNKQVLIDCIDFAEKINDTKVVLVVGCQTEQDTSDGNPSIKEYCEKNKIEYINPQKIDQEVIKLVQSKQPDVCFSVLYRNIFKSDLLKIPKLGFVNMHPSLLPKYRGPVPRLWAMLNGEDTIGVTLHYIDEGIDTGDIIDQHKIKITNRITGNQLSDKLNTIGHKLFKKNFENIINGNANRTPQDHSKATYYGQFNPKLREINWYEPKKIILRRIDMLTRPYSGAVAKLDDDNEIIVWAAKEYSLPKNNLKGPGRIVSMENGEIVVSTIDGFIKITDYDVSLKSNKFVL